MEAVRDLLKINLVARGGRLVGKHWSDLTETHISSLISKLNTHKVRYRLKFINTFIFHVRSE